jgi:hypothetical protein
MKMRRPGYVPSRDVLAAISLSSPKSWMQRFFRRGKMRRGKMRRGKKKRKGGEGRSQRGGKGSDALCEA